MRTTIGQLFLEEALPADMRHWSRTPLDKKAIASLLAELARKHPDKYREVSHELLRIGAAFSASTAAGAFGLQHLRQPEFVRKNRQRLQEKLQEILARPDLTDEDRDAIVLREAAKLQAEEPKGILEESFKTQNPLAIQVISGSRGNEMNLATLRGSDLLYVDHRYRPIPFVVARSYSQGLRPAEHWAGAYGTRRSLYDTKFSVRDAGYYGKILAQAVHRLLVTAIDAEDRGRASQLRGLPVDVDDPENEGALLAAPAGGYRRNTVLTPKILADLKIKGIKKIIVRSPAVGGPPDGGLYARDVGVREFGRLPAIGENVAMAAAGALSEPVSQAQLGSKHSGGVAGAKASKSVGGFALLQQVIQVPQVFQHGATHAEVDGRVERIAPAPAGGYHVRVAGKDHYVPAGLELRVKRGDYVEAGDALSDGEPNPAVIVRHKGIGEGRRYFIKALKDAYAKLGIRAHRRNLEILARGLINHVQLTDEYDGGVPDDIVPYQDIEHRWVSRPDSRSVAPRQALGKYLEQPVLHYTIGTPIRPSVVRELEEAGIQSIEVHDNPPPFAPVMVRGSSNLQYDPDWMVRMYGSGLKATLLRGVARGAESSPLGTSFVPGLAGGRFEGPWAKYPGPTNQGRFEMGEAQ